MRHSASMSEMNTLNVAICATIKQYLIPSLAPNSSLKASGINELNEKEI